MLSTAVFAISLLGLLALFGFKMLELNWNTKTPLTPLRRVADPILTHGWVYCRDRLRKAVSAGFHASVIWVSTTVRKIEVAFYATVHGITARLNRYLRTRRLHIRHGNEVSAHLKTVLEKTEKDSKESGSH
ncbi:MAG TPA: hypothetical protein DEF00_00610 [Candidatus Taylorbacteria bacterium]|nr:MAG: hypothetical protein UY03_C0011G0020 [Parcubacteria group bacterium GW2011_GWA2_47_64]KKU96981.1 MAG: hypothetical protein UY29_C0004G0035 [Parcubacteria group bacterium GW2011_GWC2_48_17]HBV00881.1 hypothetical protein [Candidatus Taylorbacteria bacterium]